MEIISIPQIDPWIGVSGEPITLTQMLLRAVVVFLIGIALIRIATPRIFSKATAIDIIMSVIIGSNLSRTLTGNAPFVEVISATVFLVALHFILTLAAARWRFLSNLLKGQPVVLVRDGKIEENAMLKSAMGRRDLQASIRSHGGQTVEEVRLAVLERNGDIDVIFK